MEKILGVEGGEKEVLELNKYVVGSVPTVMYIPEYISTAEEDLLLKNIYQAPLSKWKTLKNRRLQNWGGVVHEKGLLAQELPSWLKRVTNRICEESKLFPSAINHVLINEYLPDQGIMPHQDGPAYMPVVAILSLGSPVVMDFVPHPNLESTAETSENDTQDIIYEPSVTKGYKSSKYLPFSVVLMPRSLLIFKDMAYSDYLHGIKDSENHCYDEAVNAINGPSHDAETLAGLKIDGGDRVVHRTTTRVSLTCRLVTKVHKHLIKI
ncbi:uncharacterized protein LOC130999614 isoform X2 [Salvia miltiorrhiza]|uniref:uncharacterized protein LOC130999614 isoform X2 n=1 Tax=Salvia miltiorrhiza TaxID=226208 RepID=UPI0025AB7609|nr:uncharacterized protein LOC130999614 isoform X2 [Salvia miltiorrhiza]